MQISQGEKRPYEGLALQAGNRQTMRPTGPPGIIWVVVKIMVPFWVPIIIRHLIFSVPETGP